MDTIRFFGKRYECDKKYELFRKDTPYGAISISAKFYYEYGNEAATVYFNFKPYGLDYDCTCYVYREIDGKYSGKYVGVYKDYDVKNNILSRYYYYGNKRDIWMYHYNNKDKYKNASLLEYSVDQVTENFINASDYSLDKIYTPGFNIMNANTANGQPMKGESAHYTLYDGSIDFYIGRNHYTEDDIDIIANLNNGKTCSARLTINRDKNNNYFYKIIDYPSSSMKRANRNGVFPSNVTTEEDAIICAEYLMADLIFHSLKSSLATAEKQYNKLKKAYDHISKYIDNNEEAKNEKR